MKTMALLGILLIVAASFAPADLKPVDTEDAVTFSIKNFGLNVKGRLTGIAGNINWQPDNPAASSFNVTVSAASVNTGITARDNHLRKEEYFYTDKFPQIKFESTAVTGQQGNYQVLGKLTIKTTTQPVTIPFTVEPSAGGYVFSGSFTINRRDFNVGGGSMIMGNDVKVALKITARG